MNSKIFNFHSCRYLFIAVAFVAVHSAQVWAAPNVQADSAILINARNGAVIYEKNADTRRSPASLTKVMTYILGLEEKGTDSIFNISMAAAATEYSDLGMKGGEKIISGELMRGMMMESDNGAAVVVAQNVSGNILKFADLMNAKAKSKTTSTYLIIGFLIPLVLIILSELLNNKIRSPKDVVKLKMFRLIGTLRHAKNQNPTLVRASPRSSYAEMLRAIRTRIEFVLRRKDKMVICVTSTESGDGKTFLSTNLAAFFTNDVLPQRRGDTRIVLIPASKFIINCRDSCSRSVKL